VKNWGIRTRVLLLALFPAVTIAVTLAGYMVYRVSSDFERDLHNYGLGLSRQLAAVSEFSTYSGDRETLRKVALAALDETHVTAVAVFDDRGLPIASSGALPGKLAAMPQAGQPFLMESDEERMIFAAPIVRRRYEVDDPFLTESTPPAWPKYPAAIGWITLELTRAATQKRKQEVIFFTLLSTFVVLGLGGLLAAILGRQVTRPILRLEAAVSRIQDGDLDARVPADSGGDLQRLEEGMNAMAHALNENRELLEHRISTATHELEEKKNEAERSNLAKSRFLAAASHDLRQPLHALSLFAADLRHESVTPPQQRLARQINESVRSISELLDALLDISRLDVAGVTPAAMSFPLEEIFRRLDAGLARGAAAKSLRFVCRPTPLWVNTDPALLERLLGNLLSNAVRYTEKGGVLLVARRCAGHVRIEVRDSGIGIAPEHRQPIFEEFFQVGNIARTQDQGLGLGLAIVSRLARILGLTVELRSVPGRGSIFSVTLPLARPVSRVPASATPGRDAGSQAPRLLLLRPETPLLQKLADLATNWGFHSAWADSFDEARERARQEGMVIVGMAEMAGSAALANPSGEDPPLILLGTPGEQRPAHAHLMPLPLRPAKLRALLTQLLPATA